MRPAAILFTLDKKYVFQQEEEHVLVRYEDEGIPKYECISVGLVVGIR